MNIQSLLASIRQRTTHRGISTAAPFLRELTSCLGGVCPSKVLADVSGESWAAMLKEAESRLVYHADEMTIGDAVAGVEVGPDVSDGTDEARIKATAVQLPPHTIATFPAVITTTRRDRDGDVLETKGAELDPAAPLLWQHLPTEPIGRLLAEGKRTKNSLMGSFSIADTALGQDAALLAEHGALRISHGFLPDEFEPLDEKNGFGGFHILAFKILEVSLVSVPSNPDAVITLFSREKLAHPLVRAWAGAKFGNRAVLVSGGVVSSAGSRSNESPHTPRASPLAASEMDQESARPIVQSKRKDPPTRWCIKMLKKSLGHCAAIAANPDATTLIADEANKAQGHIEDVIETIQDGGVVSDQRKPLASTTHHSQLTTHHSPTTHDSQLTTHPKSGRTFSAANLRKLQAAAANFKAIARDDEAHPEVAGLADKGHTCVKSLFATGGDSGDGADDMDAYTFDGSSADDDGQRAGGKAGRAVSAANAAIVGEAISHAQAIKAHDEATPGHKSMAKTAIKKLRGVLASDELPADPDGDMEYQRGREAGSEKASGGREPPVHNRVDKASGGREPPVFNGVRTASPGPRPFKATCRAMIAAATSSLAATDDPAELNSLAKALKKARKQVDDTIARFERQRVYEAERAAIGWGRGKTMKNAI
jgi:hypothetical protein